MTQIPEIWTCDGDFMRKFVVFALGLLTFQVANAARTWEDDIRYLNFRYIECYSNSGPIARYIVADYDLRGSHPVIEDGQISLIANLDRSTSVSEKSWIGEKLNARMRAQFHALGLLPPSTYGVAAYNLKITPLVKLQCDSAIAVKIPNGNDLEATAQFLRKTVSGPVPLLLQAAEYESLFEKK